MDSSAEHLSDKPSAPHSLREAPSNNALHSGTKASWQACDLLVCVPHHLGRAGHQSTSLTCSSSSCASPAACTSAHRELREIRCHHTGSSVTMKDPRTRTSLMGLTQQPDEFPQCSNSVFFSQQNRKVRSTQEHRLGRQPLQPSTEPREDLRFPKVSVG